MDWEPGSKIALEHEAAKLFMRQYEALSGKITRHIWHNQPRKPDVSCYLEGERLDLEIAHLYATEEEARACKSGDEPALVLSDIEVSEALISSLNELLLKKSEKQYHTQRVWLVIRNINQQWQQQDFIDHLAEISVPLSHPFEMIWLVADQAGTSGLVQLFPVWRGECC